MEKKLIKTINLANGLELKILDASRKLAGDRWLVALIARIEIPINDLLLKTDDFPSLNVDEIKKAFGEKISFEQKREKIFIDDDEKDNIMKEIQDSFLNSSLSYLSRSDFPQKYILKKINEKIKKESWCVDTSSENNI